MRPTFFPRDVKPSGSILVIRPGVRDNAAGVAGGDICFKSFYGSSAMGVVSVEVLPCRPHGATEYCDVFVAFCSAFRDVQVMVGH